MNLTVLPPLPKPKLNPIMSLEELWATWVHIKGDIADKTRYKYKLLGRYFCNFMRGKILDQKSIVEWVLYTQTIGLKPYIVNERSVFYRAFLRWLKKMLYVYDDLGALIPNLKCDLPPEPKIITEEDYEKLKKFMTGKLKYQPYLWLTILGYRTGMSLVDCCHLRWNGKASRVHLDTNGPSYIEVYRHKTKRLGLKAKCTIPIIPLSDVHEWLLMLKEAEPLNYKRFDGITDFVHQDCPGLYIWTKRRIAEDFMNIFQRAGIEPGKTFRHFRNTFCSNLVNSGVQTALICKMTGHNNIKMLLRYLKPDQGSLQNALMQSQSYSASLAEDTRSNSGLVPINEHAS